MRNIHVVPCLLLTGCLGKVEEIDLDWSVAPEPVTLSTSYASSKIVGSGDLAILNEDTLDLMITPLAFDGDGADLLETDLEPLQDAKAGKALTLSIEIRGDYVLWQSGDYQPSLIVQISAFTDPVGSLEEPELIGPDQYSIPIQFTIVCDEDGDGDEADVCMSGTDCDDGDATMGPSSPELCDGIDNDCDGQTDEDDATDQATWYLDLDDDDYGDSSTTTLSCEKPDGYVDNGADCDDLKAATYPGADELCDEIDNDCDLEIDELGSTDADNWYMDLDEDGQGDPDNDIKTCDRPDGYVDNKKDCDDTNKDVYEGAVEVCDEADNDCDDKVDEGLDCGVDTGAP